MSGPAQPVWKALLDRIEHPEAYGRPVSRAVILDHDARTVARRSFPLHGAPYDEWVRRVPGHRVENYRIAGGWATAQALVEEKDGTWLVYEVLQSGDGRRAALAGITRPYALRVLHALAAAAGARHPVSRARRPEPARPSTAARPEPSRPNVGNTAVPRP